MKRIVFLLLLVYASSILNVSELYAEKVKVAWYNETTEKEKKEKEKRERKKEKEKNEVEQKEIKDYTHSIGIAVGFSYGLAYKYFFKDNWALKVDATYNVYRGFEYNAPRNFDFNPNVVYQLPLKTFKTCRLDFFAGGGTTFGYAYAYHGWYDYHKCYNGYLHKERFSDESDAFVWGFNGILGLEVNLAIPMTIEFDFRPGYGLYAGYFFDSYSCDNYGYPDGVRVNCNYSNTSWERSSSFFEWSVNATISYKF